MWSICLVWNIRRYEIYCAECSNKELPKYIVLFGAHKIRRIRYFFIQLVLLIGLSVMNTTAALLLPKNLLRYSIEQTGMASIMPGFKRNFIPWSNSDRDHEHDGSHNQAAADDIGRDKTQVLQGNPRKDKTEHSTDPSCCTKYGQSFSN